MIVLKETEETYKENKGLNSDYYYKLTQEFKYLYDEWGDITDHQDEKLKIMITINSIILSVVFIVLTSRILGKDSVSFYNVFTGLTIIILLLLTMSLFISGLIYCFLAVFPIPSYWKINDDDTINFYLVKEYPKEYKNKLRDYSNLNYYKCARYYEKLWMARMDGGLRKNEYLYKVRTFTIAGFLCLFIVIICIFLNYSIINF